MKIKKETILLVLIILALSAYLFVQKKGKTHYSLPEMKKLEQKDISKLTITKGESEIALLRDGDQWKILPQNFPADKELVKKMADEISTITLTALASESKNYSVYQLDEKNKIEVKAYRGDEALRNVEIGKVASSNRHTFVKVGDDQRVFHARGNLNNVFNKTVPNLRDKTVMNFDDDIAEVSLMEGDKKMVVVKASAPVSIDVGEQQDEKEGTDEKSQKPMAKWQTDKGDPVKEKEIDAMINALSDLECDDFVEDKTKEDLTDPAYTVSLKGVKTYSLSLFEKKDNKYLATSTESEYPFLLAEWKAKKFMKDLDALREPEEKE